jgi:hypothetical protein
VLTPGFAADCLETLEEIGVENAEYFHAAGGEKFVALPCLNDSVTYDLRSSIAKGLDFRSRARRQIGGKPRPPATP